MLSNKPIIRPGDYHSTVPAHPLPEEVATSRIDIPIVRYTKKWKKPKIHMGKKLIIFKSPKNISIWGKERMYKKLSLIPDVKVSKESKGYFIPGFHQIKEFGFIDKFQDKRRLPKRNIWGKLISSLIGG